MQKIKILAIVAIAFFVSIPDAEARKSKSNYYSGYSSTTHVKGYFRKNGTYVAPHARTKADRTQFNNWTTEGNINPYTNEIGTKKAYK